MIVSESVARFGVRAACGLGTHASVDPKIPTTSLLVFAGCNGEEFTVMAQETVADGDIDHWLQSVGVESLCQWDVLTFLYRHGTTLLLPKDLARLLGYRLDPVIVALDSLAALQILQWSAQSRGASSYWLIVRSVPSRNDALDRLLALSDHRSGRLLLDRHLGRGERTPHEGLRAARHFLDDADMILDRIKRFCGSTSDTPQ